MGKDDFGKCILERLKKDGVDPSHVFESRERSTGCALNAAAFGPMEGNISEKTIQDMIGG